MVSMWCAWDLGDCMHYTQILLVFCLLMSLYSCFTICKGSEEVSTDLYSQCGLNTNAEHGIAVFTCPDGYISMITGLELANAMPCPFFLSYLIYSFVKAWVCSQMMTINFTPLTSIYNEWSVPASCGDFDDCVAATATWVAAWSVSVCRMAYGNLERSACSSVSSRSCLWHPPHSTAHSFQARHLCHPTSPWLNFSRPGRINTYSYWKRQRFKYTCE